MSTKKINITVSTLFIALCIQVWLPGQSQSIYLSPAVISTTGGTQRNGNFMLTGTAGQLPGQTLKQGNFQLTQQFEQNIKPEPPVPPANQTACSDTPYTFTFSNVQDGKGANQVEWALNNSFDSSHIVSNGGSIVVTVSPGHTDTVWSRSIGIMKSEPVYFVLQVGSIIGGVKVDAINVKYSFGAQLGDSLIPDSTAEYLWQPGFGLSDSTIANPIFWGYKSGQYLVKISSAAGCIRSDTVSVTVDSLLPPIVPLGQVISSDTSVTFAFPNIQLQLPGYQIQWSPDSLFKSYSTITTADTIFMTVPPGTDSVIWLRSYDPSTGNVSRQDYTRGKVQGTEGTAPVLSSEPTLLDKSGWQLVFYDEFNTYSTADELLSATLPSSSTPMWSAQYSWGPWISTSEVTDAEPCDPSFTVSGNLIDASGIEVCPGTCTLDGKSYNGLLQLFVNTSGGNQTYVDDQGSHPYFATVGGISSNWDEPTSASSTGFMGGMFEIRCRLPSGVVNSEGMLPSFWLYGTNEYDVFEINGQANEFHSTNHDYCPWYSSSQGCDTTGEGICNHYYVSSDAHLNDEFHTWTFVWVPIQRTGPLFSNTLPPGAKVTWFFDGKEIKTMYNLAPQSTPPNSGYTQSRGLVSLDCSQPGNNCSWDRDGINIDAGTLYTGASSSDPLIVDYVKAYKPKDNNTSGWLYQQYSSSSPDNNTSIVQPAVTNVSGVNITLNQYDGNIFYQDNAGGLWNYWGTNDNNNDCIDCGNTDVQNDIAYYNDRLYYRSQDNQLKYYEWNGTTWIQNSTSGYQDCGGYICTPNNDAVVYLSLWDNNIHGGFTWNGGWVSTTVTHTGNVQGGIVCHSLGYIIYYVGTDDNVYRLTWNGAWSQAEQITFDENATLYMAYDDNDDIAYYIGKDGRIYQCNATGYSALSTDLGDDDASNFIALSPDKKIIYYVASDNQMRYYFQDNGNMATTAISSYSGGLNNHWYRSCIDHAVTNAAGPVATRWDGTIFFSNQSGNMCQAPWQTCELPVTWVNTEYACYGDYPSNGGTNIYKSDFISSSDTSTSNIPDSSISSTVAVFPNPSNEDFIFNYKVANSCQITLSIIDENGTVLSRPFTGQNITTGQYSYNLNGSNLASGIYYYRFIIGTQIFYGKLMKI